MDMSPSPHKSCQSLPTQPGANACSTSSLSQETSSSHIKKNTALFPQRACTSFIDQEEFVQLKKQHRNRPKSLCENFRAPLPGEGMAESLEPNYFRNALTCTLRGVLP